jgi:hypothetical protein
LFDDERYRDDSDEEVKKIFFSLSSFNECYYANGMCRESPKHECLHGITTFPSQFQSNSIISCETEQSNITHDPLKGFSVMQRDEMQEKREVGEGNGRRTAANFMAVALLYRRCKRTSVPTEKPSLSTANFHHVAAHGA